MALRFEASLLAAAVDDEFTDAIYFVYQLMIQPVLKACYVPWYFSSVSNIWLGSEMMKTMIR